MAYVGGSPMQATDPSGMMAQTFCGYPPGATVKNRETGETYTADSHGCITVGGGGATVDVTAGPNDWPIWMNPDTPISFFDPPPIPLDPFGGDGAPPKPKPCNFLAWQSYLDNLKSILNQFQNATNNNAALSYYKEAPSSEPEMLKRIETFIGGGTIIKSFRSEGADALTSVMLEEGGSFFVKYAGLPIFSFPLAFGQVWNYMDGITNVNLQVNAAARTAMDELEKAHHAYENQAIADCYGK